MFMCLELPVMRRAPVIQSRNASSVTVRWRAWRNTPSSGMGPVVGYILYYHCHNDTDWKQVPQTRSRTLTITGLQVNQSYEISVSAVHQTGLIGPRSPAAETATCGSMSVSLRISLSVFVIYYFYLLPKMIHIPEFLILPGHQFFYFFSFTFFY